MAWVRKGKGGYSARYRGPDGKTRAVPGGPWRHKAAAERAAASAEAEARWPGWRDPAAGLMTWAEWCEAWWPSRSVEASTLASDVGRRDMHLLPRWGEVALVDITRHDIRAWAAELRNGEGTARRPLAPETVQRIVHLLSASLAAAVDAEILPGNPAARLKLGGGKGSSERYLTHEEFDAVCEHLEGEYLVMARLLAFTGLRWGEAVGLHADRVDRRRGVLSVVETWSLRGRHMKAYPKGGRVRDVPLPAWIELPATPAATCGYEHVSGRCRAGLAVTTPQGAMIDQPKFQKRWAAAVRAAGIGHARVHDLRHTYASWLLQDGVSLAEVGQLLGHVSPITTQRYAHLSETPSQAVLQALRHGAPIGADLAQPDANHGLPSLTLVKGGNGG